LDECTPVSAPSAWLLKLPELVHAGSETVVHVEPSALE
jgi:hypothetical protein